MKKDTQCLVKFEDDIIDCGCWRGNLADFEKKVKATYKDNKRYLTEYLSAIKFFKEMKKMNKGVIK